MDPGRSWSATVDDTSPVPVEPLSLSGEGQRADVEPRGQVVCVGCVWDVCVWGPTFTIGGAVANTSNCLLLLFVI